MGTWGGIDEEQDFSSGRLVLVCLGVAQTPKFKVPPFSPAYLGPYKIGEESTPKLAALTY